MSDSNATPCECLSGTHFTFIIHPTAPGPVVSTAMACRVSLDAYTPFTDFESQFDMLSP
jgi:hypothetical protein